MSKSDIEIANKKFRDQFRRSEEAGRGHFPNCGDIVTVPGLPRAPAANAIFVTGDGQIERLI